MAVHEDLDFFDRDYLIRQYEEWTVVEDREALDGASARLARTLVPLSIDATLWLPRFTYCLYVDWKCPDTLVAHEATKTVSCSWPPHLVTAVIDGDFSPQPREDTSSNGDYPIIEGCTPEYVSREYISARNLAGLYDELHYRRLKTTIDRQLSVLLEIVPCRIDREDFYLPRW
ncbi:hypothetical protein GGR52DRAFT_570352 [Hypoxylon sp. FL1284]|nr:hypothetical protein GGR52DRAFT_570352 [Hypoxylon sp. FL1284]